MISCDVCFKAAMLHGGNLVVVPVDGVRHWRPDIIWNGSAKKVQSKEPIPIFCVTRSVPKEIPEFGDYSSNKQKRTSHRSGIPLA